MKIDAFIILKICNDKMIIEAGPEVMTGEIGHGRKIDHLRFRKEEDLLFEGEISYYQGDHLHDEDLLLDCPDLGRGPGRDHGPKLDPELDLGLGRDQYQYLGLDLDPGLDR